MLVFTLLIVFGSIFILKKNFLMYFISLELIVLAINLQYIFASLAIENSCGLFVAVILLAITVIDTTIGLYCSLYSILGKKKADKKYIFNNGFINIGINYSHLEIKKSLFRFKLLFYGYLY